MKAILYIPALLMLLTSTLSVMAQSCNINMLPDKPDSRYSDNSDGTVTDNVTGLMWKQCQEGLTTTVTTCDSGSPPSFNWHGALSHVQSVNGSGGFAGHSDWRLPNVKELKSLTSAACYSPSINLNVFPATLANLFWTATPDTANPGSAMAVSFIDGMNRTVLMNGYYYIRLVRDTR